MEILHVITGLQKAAGTSVFCGELANELVAQGDQVTVAVMNPKDEDCYPLDSKVRLVSIKDILKLYGGFEVVHIHALWPPILHCVSQWAHRNGLPVVWSPHGMLAPWAMAHKRWKKILPWYLYQKNDLKRAVVLHATSEMESGWLCDLGFTQKNVIAPLGTHLPSPVPPRHHKVKSILFVGRIYPVKGLNHLIAAWSFLSPGIRHGWQIRLTGPDQAGHMEELKELAGQFGVSSEINFTGPLFGAQLDATYRDSDLFVLPSFTENFGGVVVDAMSYGLPVITTKGTPWGELENCENALMRECINAGMRECLNERDRNQVIPQSGSLEQSENHSANAESVSGNQALRPIRAGWWIDIGVEPLVHALMEAMSLTDEERCAMGENGRRLVERKYTWPAIMSTIIEAYRSVI